MEEGRSLGGAGAWEGIGAWEPGGSMILYLEGQDHGKGQLDEGMGAGACENAGTWEGALFCTERDGEDSSTGAGGAASAW